MEKTITTGIEITFKKTKDIFELIQTPTGFDVKPVKFTKNVQTEPYTFQELLDQYESGKITIDGFEEADAALVRSILTNYIHQTNLQEKLKEIETLKTDIARIIGEKEAFEAESLQLKTTNQELTTANERLTAQNSELGNNNRELAADNKRISDENKELKIKNEKLNAAFEQEEAEK